MPFSESNIIVGLQWGNEGKPQIVDYLAQTADVVARFQGCSSSVRLVAGEDGEYRFNHLPGGFTQDGVKTLVCGGVTLDLERFAHELKTAREKKLLKSDLVVSKNCHLILDHHKKLDVLDGRAFGHAQNRTLDDMGLGYCCADKYRRMGILVSDLLDRELLYGKLERVLRVKNSVFEKMYGEKPFDIAQQCEKYWVLGRVLAPYVGDAETLLGDACRSNLRIVFEGCDSTLNDIDAGPYPYAMPLSSVSGSVFLASGAQQKLPMRVIGVAKAYSARRDEAPFVTEESGAVGSFIRSRGKEFSEITGAPNRIGWLDLPALKYALRRNGVDLLALTNLSVLTGIDEIKVCVSYHVGGSERPAYDLAAEEIAEAEPLYKIFEGWTQELSDSCDFRTLPPQAQDLLRFIEDAAGTPLLCVGAGTDLEKHFSASTERLKKFPESAQKSVDMPREIAIITNVVAVRRIRGMGG